MAPWRALVQGKRNLPSHPLFFYFRCANDIAQGISIPVGDAAELVKVLPDVVRQAEIREDQLLRADLQREATPDPATPSGKSTVVASHTPVDSGQYCWMRLQ